MSLWGTKKKNDDQEEHEDEGEQEQTNGMAPSRTPRSQNSRSREPTERDRLLAGNRPPPNEGYLDPDDPAVSEATRKLNGDLLT